MLEWIQQTDERCLEWIAQTLRTPLLNIFFKFYTFLGNAGWFFIAVSIMLVLFRATRKAGVAALTGMTFGLLVTNLVLKPLVARARPWVVMENFTALVKSSDMNSFPSGHTTAAFAFAAALAVTLPQKWAKAAALVAAALMGWSRLYVGVHFPSDVLAGVVVGALCGLAGTKVIRLVIGRLASRKDPG